MKKFTRFYSIPCVRKMIAGRQANFIGKMIQGPPNQPSRNMITTCCDHKQQDGWLQTTRKNFMVENLHLLFQDITTVHIDHYRSLRDWIHKASNKKYWNQLVNRLLHLSTLLPEHPAAWGPLPSWSVHWATNNNQRPANHDEDNGDNENNNDNGNDKSNGRHQPPPSPQHAPSPREPPTSSLSPPTQYKPKQWLNDPNFCAQVRRSMFHSLTILRLGLGASEIEIKIHY